MNTTRKRDTFPPYSNTPYIPCYTCTHPNPDIYYLDHIIYHYSILIYSIVYSI